MLWEQALTLLLLPLTPLPLSLCFDAAADLAYLAAAAADFPAAAPMLPQLSLTMLLLLTLLLLPLCLKRCR